MNDEDEGTDLARILPQRRAGKTHHHCDENRTSKVPFRESAALVARIGSNLRSQFGILANADANRRECRANWLHYNYLCNINALLADQGGFEPTVQFRKYLFEMSAEFPLMCREMAG